MVVLSMVFSKKPLQMCQFSMCMVQLKLCHMESNQEVQLDAWDKCVLGAGALQALSSFGGAQDGTKGHINGI